MTLFQWLAGGLMVAFAVAELFLQFMQLSRRSISSIRFSVWLVALLSILYPGATGVIANFLSIGRGADLVLYSSVIAFVVAFFYVIHALEKQREQLTLLVRRIAISEPYAVSNRSPSTAEPTEIASERTGEI